MPERPGFLAAANFATFYRNVHGVDPFPWQDDLVARVLADGCWPDLVDVPTGLGKTSTLDIAVFVAAATAANPGSSRVGRRRCFFVVDRRIVVDEAYAHATALADAIERARGHDGVTGRVAAGLRAYAPDATGALLPVTRMRGGTTWDAAWLDRPDRPGIVLGTVDQVGSRLLFRGYGVSDRRRPLDAALVGTDSLVLVDEAHLATALLTTVTAARSRDALGLPLPGLDVVRLSATGEPTPRTHRLDETTHRDHPVAWQRLTAAKRLWLRESTVKTCARDLAGTVTDQLAALDGAGEGAPVALVVCNTVDRAREVHTHLRKTLADADCELLIGRSRPLDRGDLQERVLHRFGTARVASPRPAVLVATQTVEVGVNLDVDVLVTESASWDALVQRLGRLNRLGGFVDRFSSHDAATAFVVHDGQVDGPVYGTARDTTWNGLNQLDTGTATGIDVCPLACRRLTASAFAEPGFIRQPAGVPVLLRPTLDAWVQTGPVPLNDPPVAPYLHGFDAGTAPVQILWREELVEPATTALVDPFDDPLDDVERASPQIDVLLTLWPPRSEEIVEVPFVTARRWIDGLGTGPVGDVDGAAEPEMRTPRLGEPFRVLAQRSILASASGDSPLSWQWLDALQLRPGDRIVVPTRRGGLDQYGWAPADPSPVVDVSEPAGFVESRSRRDAVLRLDSGLVDRLGIDADENLSDALHAARRPDDDVGGSRDGRGAIATDVALALAARLLDAPPPGSGWSTSSWRTLRNWLTNSQLRIVEVTDPIDSWLDGGRPPVLLHLLTGPRPVLTAAATKTAAARSGGVAEGDDDEVGASSVGSGRVTLDNHHDAVGARAAQIVRALALPAGIAGVVENAARWHDLGKCDTRFQVMLHGGDAVEAALTVEPLAKSGLDTTDKMAWRRAAHDSGLPPGARHEAWSAALVQEHLDQHPYNGDVDLLIHLVASHHGNARPWPKLVTDPDPRSIEALIAGDKLAVSSRRTVCLDQPGRFARLNDRYGRWGLALLEAIVRCADTTVSGEGS